MYSPVLIKAYNNACASNDAAKSTDTTIVDLQIRLSAPRLLNVPTLSDEKAPPASVFARCISTSMISRTDSTMFAAKIRDCIPSIIS